MGFTPIEGRYFSEEFGSSLSHYIILNKSAVRQSGITDPPVKASFLQLYYLNSNLRAGSVNNFNSEFD
jgi:hypothetical protein